MVERCDHGECFTSRALAGAADDDIQFNRSADVGQSRNQVSRSGEPGA